MIVINYGKNNRYIRSVMLNGQKLGRNWLTQQEIMLGGRLTITASNAPNKIFAIARRFLTSITQ